MEFNQNDYARRVNDVALRTIGALTIEKALLAEDNMHLQMKLAEIQKLIPDGKEKPDEKQDGNAEEKQDDSAQKET